MARTNPITPSYSYDDLTGRYRNTSTGRFVPATEIRAALDAFIVSAKAELPRLTNQLREGRLSLPEWQTRMASTIRVIHTASGAAAKGGWAKMTPADYGRVGQLTRTQYVYLQRFATALENGTQRLTGAAVTRASMYGEAARETHEQVRRIVERDMGMTEEKSILGIADHCDDCIEQAALGWQPIGTLIPIGRRDCHVRCHCTMDYR